MEIVKVDVEREKEMQTEGELVVQRAHSFVIDSDETYEQCVEMGRDVTEREERFRSFFYDGPNGEVKGGPIPAADHAKQVLLDRYNGLTKPLKSAKGILSNKGGEWVAHKRRLQREAEAKAAAESRKIQEESRQREALALEEAGQKEQAQAVIEQPIPAPPPYIAPPAAPKIKGSSVRETWTATGFDLYATICAIAKDPHRYPATLVKYDQAGLNLHARSQKGEMKTPGLRVNCETKQSFGKR